MNYQHSKTTANFWQRRYAVRLGRRYVSTAASVIILGMGGCSKFDSINSSVAQALPLQQQESPNYAQLTTPIVDQKVITANNKFGFKLFSELLKQGSSENVFISPTSVAIALAMTYNGAKGETQKAMAKTLELQGISLPNINSANAALIAAVQNFDDNVQLTVANSLWARQGVNFQPDFLQKQNFYQAKIANLDFKDPNAAKIINDWVNQSTKGKINQIVSQINPDDALFLINAIYFKGKWTQEFDKNKTTRQPFYLSAGGQKQHPLMSQTGEYRYYENEKFQAISLPYGGDRKLSLYIFLPAQNSNLTAFYQDLNAQNWETWMNSFRNRQGSIRLPRFQIDNDLTLNDTLKALGMEVVFTPQADFSGIGENLAISALKHKTFVEVNEEGTEAAATTGVGVALVSAMPQQPPFQMNVDRPFFCAIRDNQTGTVLFMGSIVDPQG